MIRVLNGVVMTAPRESPSAARGHPLGPTAANLNRGDQLAAAQPTQDPPGVTQIGRRVQGVQLGGGQQPVGVDRLEHSELEGAQRLQQGGVAHAGSPCSAAGS